VAKLGGVLNLPGFGHRRCLTCHMQHPLYRQVVEAVSKDLETLPQSPSYWRDAPICEGQRTLPTV
jgi:hypothetical protein